MDTVILHYSSSDISDPVAFTYDDNKGIPFGGGCSNLATVKPVLSYHSKIDKTMILMSNRSLMKVERIAEHVLQNVLIGTFCNTFDLH